MQAKVLQDESQAGSQDCRMGSSHSFVGGVEPWVFDIMAFLLAKRVSTTYKIPGYGNGLPKRASFLALIQDKSFQMMSAAGGTAKRTPTRETSTSWDKDILWSAYCVNGQRVSIILLDTHLLRSPRNMNANCHGLPPTLIIQSNANSGLVHRFRTGSRRQQQPHLTDTWAPGKQAALRILVFTIQRRR